MAVRPEEGSCLCGLRNQGAWVQGQVNLQLELHGNADFFRQWRFRATLTGHQWG